MARNFVTGANGFVGSHLVEYLLKRGDYVVAMTRSSSSLQALSLLSERHGDQLKLITADLRDPTSIQEALQQAGDIEIVYHLGAVLMAASEKEFRDPNVEGTRNMLRAVTHRRLPNLTRFLFVSAQAAAGPSPDGSPIDETRPLQPVSQYGKSKADAERIAAEFAERIPVTIVRPVVVYGEREKDISEGTFPMVKLGFAPKLGLGEKTACLAYVEDVVRGMVMAAENSASVGKTYFLSDPTPYKQSDVVRAIADAMGKRFLLPMFVPHTMLSVMAVFAELAHRMKGGRPMLTRDKVRELKQQWWTVTPAAAARDLGWSSQVGLQDGMARAVRDWEQRR